MKIFISWSGEKSRCTAEIISAWLKQVIQASEPWMSRDIEKGKRWEDEIATQLEQSNAGIICLTKENINEKWILFEAGALSKLKKPAHVCTFLLDLGFEEIESPLADFQNTKFDKEDMKKLVRTLNSLLVNTNERPLEEKVLDESFEVHWPKLEKDLKEIVVSKPKKREPIRTEKEILVEILEIVRTLARESEYDKMVSHLIALKKDALKKSSKGLGTWDIGSLDYLVQNTAASPDASLKGFLEELEKSSKK